MKSFLSSQRAMLIPETHFLEQLSTTTILALNIRAGGAKSVSEVARYLEAKLPQTVVLTEWRANPTGDLFKQWAKTRGMHHASLTDGQTANGVFVASTDPLEARSVTPTGGKAGVLMHVRLKGFDMLACYFPQNVAKAVFSNSTQA